MNPEGYTALGYIFESSLSILSGHPVASGSSSDVHERLLNDSRVCVKELRIYAREESQTAKKVHYQSHRLSLLAFTKIHDATNRPSIARSSHGDV